MRRADKVCDQLRKKGRVAGERTAVLLRGHGCAVASNSVERTVITLLELERNSRFLQAVLAQNRGEPRYWSAEEIAEWAEGDLSTNPDRYWEYLTTRPAR